MLHNGQTFWNMVNEPLSPYPKLKAIETCQVLIVGGGMSGIISAHNLAKNGYDCIVIEADRVGQTSSLANTGLFQWANDMNLHEGIDELGRKRAELFYRASYEGMEQLKSIAADFPNLRHFVPMESLMLASRAKDNQQVETEYKSLKARGYPVELLKQDELLSRYGIKKNYALVTKGDVAGDPLELIQTLVKDAVDRFGLRVYEQTTLRNVIEGDNLLAVIDDKAAIHCEHIVYATGYAENRLTGELGYHARLIRSYALVTKPIDASLEMPIESMLWETARPYLYVRPCPGRRMLIGGLDDDWKKTPSEHTIEFKAGQLLRELKNLFPDYGFEAEAIWGARFGESSDGLPFIGAIPGERNRYMLLGYGGNGTVYSVIGASVIMNCIAGREDPYVTLFDPGRIPVTNHQ